MSERTALITGGGGGFGRATASVLAAEGYRVCLADNNLGAAEGTVRELADLGYEAVPLELDVTDAAAFHDAAREIASRFGSIDFLFNNAGVNGTVAAIEEYPLDDFDLVIDVNLRGVFHGLRSVLPIMAAQGSGSIVNTASMAALLGVRRQIAYVASKAAVVAMTRVAAHEYAPHGIRVNAICPGPTNTAMMHEFLSLAGPDPAAILENMKTRIPLGRPGEAHEIAALVTFLASDASSYITGIAIPIDGGRSVA